MIVYLNSELLLGTNLCTHRLLFSILFAEIKLDFFLLSLFVFSWPQVLSNSFYFPHLTVSKDQTVSRSDYSPYSVPNSWCKFCKFWPLILLTNYVGTGVGWGSNGMLGRGLWRWWTEWSHLDTVIQYSQDWNKSHTSTQLYSTVRIEIKVSPQHSYTVQSGLK